MIRHYKKWTTGEKMTVRKLYAVGKTDKEIAETVGRKPHSIMLIRSKLGVVKHRKQSKALHKQSPAQAKPLSVEALKAVLPVLKALEYELTITKLGN